MKRIETLNKFFSEVSFEGLFGIPVGKRTKSIVFNSIQFRNEKTKIKFTVTTNIKGEHYLDDRSGVLRFFIIWLEATTHKVVRDPNNNNVFNVTLWTPRRFPHYKQYKIR